MTSDLYVLNIIYFIQGDSFIMNRLLFSKILMFFKIFFLHSFKLLKTMFLLNNYILNIKAIYKLKMKV